MAKYSFLLVVCALVVENIDADSHTCAGSPDCTLFPTQTAGLLTLQDVTQKIQTKHWIMIYYSDITTKHTYGKCNFRWNAPDSDGNIRRQLMCYNYEIKDCEDYERKVKRTSDSCNRASENNAMNSTMDAKFYSQKPDDYFWYDSCYEYDAANQCTTRYLDLLVSKTRYPDPTDDDDDGKRPELDLQGLPWHLIVSDLKNHFDIEISDPRMTFSWKGPECGFDGKVITSSASSGGLNLAISFIILLISCLF